MIPTAEGYWVQGTEGYLVVFRWVPEDVRAGLGTRTDRLAGEKAQKARNVLMSEL